MSDHRYCPECEAQNEAEALFCENCGAPLQTKAEEPAHKVVPKKKSAKIPIIIIVLLALTGAGVFAYFHFSQKTEVNLTKNLDTEILKLDGQNGNGSISEIDMDKVLEKWDIDNQEENVQKFLRTVELTSDRIDSDDLSNGDAIKIIAKYERANAKKYKIEVTGEEKTVKVEGLQEKPPLEKYILGKWINKNDKKDLLVIKKDKYDGETHQVILAYYGQGGSLYLGPMADFEYEITGDSSMKVNMYGSICEWEVTPTGLLKGTWGDGHTATYSKLGNDVHLTFRGQ